MTGTMKHISCMCVWERSGIWEGFIPGVRSGEGYKYHIHGFGGMRLDKGDPFTHLWERKPLTASITWGTYYEWTDKHWMKHRKKNNALTSPFLYTKFTCKLDASR
jgi:1,4-alpha-glucan branching enzyme